jgi:hypothetical protein
MKATSWHLYAALSVLALLLCISGTYLYDWLIHAQSLTTCWWIDNTQTWVAIFTFLSFVASLVLAFVAIAKGTEAK